MTKKKTLRVVSLLMLLVAVIFVFIAITHPTLGRVVYIGPFRFGAKQWRVCYAAYVVVMIGLFVASFFVKDGRQPYESIPSRR